MITLCYSIYFKYKLMRSKLLLPLSNVEKLKSNLAEGKPNELEELKDIKDNMKIIAESLLKLTE